LDPGGPGVVQVFHTPGTRTALDNILPNWNVARIDWVIPNVIRTVRKYMRMTAAAGDAADQSWNPDIIDLLTTFAEAIASQGHVCNHNGAIIDPSGFRVDPLVSLRQTYWSRRARPGFHRGYVPNV